MQRLRTVNTARHSKHKDTENTAHAVFFRIVVYLHEMDKILEALGAFIVAVVKAPYLLLKAVHDYITGTFGVSLDWILYPTMVVLFVYLVTRITLPYEITVAYMLLIVPFVAPFVLLPMFYTKWMDFVHTQFAVAQGQSILEVLVPREVFKSPEAMEQVFMQLYQKAGPDNWVQGVWDGKSSPSYSFELVSTGGAVRLYIVCPKKKFKNMIETQLYAHYPGIEVREVDIDYTAEIPSNLDGYGLFGFHFGKGGSRIGPPLRTYVDWGHQDFPKEEFKIDPMSTTLEALANAGPGEHMWLQFVIVPHKSYDWKTGSLTERPEAKKDFEADLKKKFSVKVKKKGEDGKETEVEEMKRANEMDDHEKSLYTAYKRQMNKYFFDTRIRGIYVAPWSKFNGDRIALLAGSLKGTETPGFGGLNPGRFRTDVDWPWWQNRGGKTTDRLKKAILEMYKNRSMANFENDYGTNASADADTVLSTEELATLWHIPSSTVMTPTLSRIESTRREAPANLPI